MMFLRHRLPLILAAVTSFAPLAFAVHPHKQPPRPAPCYVWQLCEECHTVYDVTYETKTEKIQVPVIKEIRQPVSCVVCKPYAVDVLRYACMPHWHQTMHQIYSCGPCDPCDSCATSCDRCGSGCCDGSCGEVCGPPIMTCVEPICYSQAYKSLEWEGILSEQVYEVVYLVREMEDRELKLEVPVKKPREIRRKVWKKYPACPPCSDCERCEICPAEPVCEQ